MIRVKKKEEAIETANIDDLIEWKDRESGKKMKGYVEKILVNSVIVQVDKYYKTVVAHKRYKILERSGNISKVPTKGWRTVWFKTEKARK